MGSFEPFKDDDLVITQEALLEVGRVMRRYIERQSRELHVDAKGNPLPKGVDLHNTGRLLSEVAYSVDEIKGFVNLVFTVDYASKVAEKYDFVGICPQLMPEFLQEIEPIIVRGINSGGGSSIGGSSGDVPDLNF